MIDFNQPVIGTLSNGVKLTFRPSTTTPKKSAPRKVLTILDVNDEGQFVYRGYGARVSWPEFKTAKVTDLTSITLEQGKFKRTFRLSPDTTTSGNPKVTTGDHEIEGCKFRFQLSNAGEWGYPIGSIAPKVERVVKAKAAPKYRPLV